MGLLLLKVLLRLISGRVRWYRRMEDLWRILKDIKMFYILTELRWKFLVFLLYIVHFSSCVCIIVFRTK